MLSTALTCPKPVKVMFDRKCRVETQSLGLDDEFDVGRVRLAVAGPCVGERIAPPNRPNCMFALPSSQIHLTLPRAKSKPRHVHAGTSLRNIVEA